MFTKTITAVALTLVMGSAAFAQPSNPDGILDPQATASTTPQGWSKSMNSAFFTDDGTTLRPEAEIRTNWSNLSEAERLQVKADCAHAVNSGAVDNTGRSDSAGQTGARNEQTAISQICLWTQNL
jgi:hypothetical protein